jgi:hypothetical protein
MMIAPKDEMGGANPAVARAAYDSISAKKELLEIAGGHFGLLHYPSELFDQAAHAQRDFLLRVLLLDPNSQPGNTWPAGSVFPG